MTEHNIVLITDSTCDLPPHLVEKHGIKVVPQVLVWGQDTLRDRVDIQPSEFYRRLTTDTEYPTTSCPTLADFAQAYEEAQQVRAAQSIVVVTVSSAMSATFQAAQQAAKKASLPVHVIDAKGPTMSVGWQVLAAARAREAGGDAEAMLQAAANVRSELVQMVYLDTLDYLHKGGRIGGAAHLVSTMLNIKLIVQIDHEAGRVEPAGRTRTRARALESLYQGFFEQLDGDKPLHIAVMHGDAAADAEALAERIRREHNPVELLVTETGPVLGVHTGPQAVALCGYASSGA